MAQTTDGTGLVPGGVIATWSLTGETVPGEEPAALADRPQAEQVFVRPDANGKITGDMVEDRRRAIQVAESVAGHVDGHTSSATAPAHAGFTPLSRP